MSRNAKVLPSKLHAIRPSGANVASNPFGLIDEVVSQLAVELAPGESSTTRFYLLGGDAEHGALEAVHTPVVNLLESREIEVGCDLPLW